MNHFERLAAIYTKAEYCDDQISCSNCLLHPYCDWCSDTYEYTDDEMQKLVDIIEHRVSADTMQLIRKYNLLKENLHLLCTPEKCKDCPYGDQDNCAPCEIITYGMDSEYYPDLYPYDDKKLADMVAALEIAKEALETKTKKEMPDYIQSSNHTTIEEDEENDETISVAESL